MDSYRTSEEVESCVLLEAPSWHDLSVSIAELERLRSTGENGLLKGWMAVSCILYSVGGALSFACPASS